MTKKEKRELNEICEPPQDLAALSETAKPEIRNHNVESLEGRILIEE